MKSTEHYIFYVSLLFYFSLWLTNSGNKIVALAFTVLPIFYYIRLKDSRVSLLLAYLASSIVFTGKSYDVQLIPPGIFPLDIYPLGYIISFVISPKHILAAIMIFVLMRDLIRSRLALFRLATADIVLFLFYAWFVFSDLFASKRLEVSLPFSLLTLEGMVGYFYIRSYAQNIRKFLPSLVWLFAGIVLFESVISFQQFINASPVYKTLEAQVNIEYFGKAVDESEFTFRPVGTFYHANSLGSALSFFLSLLFAWILGYQTPSLLYAFLTGLIVLAMTLSRSAWLGYGTSFLFLLYILEKRKHIKLPKLSIKKVAMVSVVVMLLVYYFVFPRANNSLYSFGSGGGGGNLRTLQLQDTLLLIAQHPILGVGTLMSVQETRILNPLGIFSSVPLSIHNGYLLLAAEHGIPSLILLIVFVLVCVTPMIWYIQKASLANPMLYLELGVLAGVLSLFIIGVFQPFLSPPIILACFVGIQDRMNHI